jgi:hypothetical protein
LSEKCCPYPLLKHGTHHVPEFWASKLISSSNSKKLLHPILKKELPGTNVNVMVAIAYGKSVVLCELGN